MPPPITKHTVTPSPHVQQNTHTHTTVTPSPHVCGIVDPARAKFGLPPLEQGMCIEEWMGLLWMGGVGVWGCKIAVFSVCVPPCLTTTISFSSLLQCSAGGQDVPLHLHPAEGGAYPCPPEHVEHYPLSPPPNQSSHPRHDTTFHGCHAWINTDHPFPFMTLHTPMNERQQPTGD